MKAVSVFSINPYLAIFSGEDGPRYTFDGTTMYATMPPWAANGKPRRYSVRFNANAVATNTEQHILSGTEGGVELAFYLHATLPVLTIHYRSDTGAQAVEGILDPADEISAGTAYTLEVINLGTGSQILLNGKSVDITAFEASDGIQPALTHIGAKHDGTSFFGGTIWASMLYDESPIHNTWANMGNGSLYGELEQAIVLEGDFEISFDAIYKDAGNNNIFYGGTTTWFAFDPSGNAYLQLEGTEVVGYTLPTKEDGQHVNIRLRSVSGVLEAYQDGAASGAPLPVTDGIVVDGLYRDIGGAVPLLIGAAVQNLIVKDLTKNLTWDYPLDEGPTTDTGPELIEGDPTLTGSLSTWDGSTMHLEGLNPTGTFQGTEVVAGTDYHVKFDYNTSAANTFIRLGGGGNVGLIAGPDVSTFDETLTAGGTGYILQILSDGVGDFSNFSIKAATGGDVIHNVDPSTQGNYLDQPLWDTVANFGDGVRYGELEQAIVLEGDFDIEWDEIAKISNQIIMGDSAQPSTNYVQMHYINEAVNINYNGVTLTFVGALSGIADGQHVRYRWNRAGGVNTLYADGAVVGGPIGGWTQSVRVDIFYYYGGAGATPMPANSAMQNIVIKDLDKNLTWDYGLDEGSGTDIINSDPSTPGYNGSWTPDTSWQPTGSYTHNGMWTDTDWTFIANNTRRYPMNDGPDGGGQFKCIDGTGTEQPALAADIIGYDEGAWD